MNPSSPVTVRVPFRLSLCGGGTDFPAYFEGAGASGRVLSFAIDRYITVSLAVRRFSYMDSPSYYITTEDETAGFLSLPDIPQDVIRQVYEEQGILKADLTIQSDLPSKGTGLGTSSALAIAMHLACQEIRGMPGPDRGNYPTALYQAGRLAEKANRTEIVYLKRPMGHQDAYPCAYGDVGLYQFSDAHIGPIPLDPDFRTRVRNAVNSHLLLFDLAEPRRSETVLSEQNARTEINRPQLDYLVECTDRMRDAFEDDRLLEVGEILHETWMRKRNFASNVSNSRIDELYALARKSGATGGKVAGAGGGGYLMLWATPHTHPDIRQAMENAGIREEKVQVSRTGAQVMPQYTLPKVTNTPLPKFLPLRY